MAIVERYISPDGLLKLIVERAEDGDWSLGFEGFAWHVHGDSLGWCGYVGSPEQRVRAFIADIIESRRVIVISRLAGAVRDTWVTDDPTQDELKYAELNETIEKRYWNGHIGDDYANSPER